MQALARILRRIVALFRGEAAHGGTGEKQPGGGPEEDERHPKRKAPQGPPAGPRQGHPEPEVMRTVYLVGEELDASDTVMLAAFEAGLVESGMENLDFGDRDSVGVFQQRPSQGWGTAEQCMNVRHASHRFFGRAIEVEREHTGLSAGRLAQEVQVSAFPERYDQREAEARRLLEATREAVDRAS